MAASRSSGTSWMRGETAGIAWAPVTSPAPKVEPQAQNRYLDRRHRTAGRHAVAKPEIIGSIRSTYTRTACMVCEEKGIDYVLTETPLRAAELRAIHPFGKMPVLRHGDVELCESKAIATWLDRSFPAPYVFPSEPRLAALTEQLVSLVNTVIERTVIRTYLFAYIAPGTADGKPNRAPIDAVMPAV